MRSNYTEPQPTAAEPAMLELSDLRRIITRHRREHDQAVRSFREWQSTWSVNERVMDEQLTRIGLQLTNRLQRLALL